MKIARREFAHLAASVAYVPATLRTARAPADPLQPVRILFLIPGYVDKSMPAR
jgi:hypothetical protein